MKVLDFGLSKNTRADSLEPSLTSAIRRDGLALVHVAGAGAQPQEHRRAPTSGALGTSSCTSSSATGARSRSRRSVRCSCRSARRRPRRSALTSLTSRKHSRRSSTACLEKAPSSRFQTVAELSRALAPFASEEARVSIERVLRTLDDRAPLSPRAPFASVPEMDAVGPTYRSSRRPDRDPAGPPLGPGRPGLRPRRAWTPRRSPEPRSRCPRSRAAWLAPRRTAARAPDGAPDSSGSRAMVYVLAHRARAHGR